MKRLLYLFCSIIIVGCNQAQIHQTDLEKNNLKGPVYTVVQKSYMDGSLSNRPGANAEGSPDQYLEFNTAGNLVLKKEFGNDGYQATDTFIYNPKGQLVKQINTRYTSHNSMHSNIRELYYDADGKRIGDRSVFVEGKDSSITNSDYEYNEKGQLIRINHSKQNGMPSVNEMTYYNNGQVRSNRYVNKILETEFVTQYDEAGRPVEKNYVGYLKTTYRNNAQGDPETITLSYPPVNFACTYTYDEQGNWTQQEQVPDRPSYPHSRYIIVRTITYR